MSSSNPDEPETLDGEIRDDELSKRFYYCGLFGLPWLWIVHAIHYHGKRRHIEAQRMLREEQQTTGKIESCSKRFNLSNHIQPTRQSNVLLI